MSLSQPTGNAKSRRRTVPSCRHCGSPSVDGEFCCSGCAYVHQLIHAEGLDAYYKIKDGVLPPADSALRPTQDYGWLGRLQVSTEAVAIEAGRLPRMELAVQGISCAGCVWLIERLFAKMPGAGRIELNAQTGQVRLTWQLGREFSAPDFAAQLQRFNYLLGPPGMAGNRPSESRGLVRRIGLCGAFVMNVMLFTLPAYFGMEASFAYARLFDTLALGFATLSLLVGGGYFLGRAVQALREGALHIDLPIAVGIVGAYLGSLFGWLANRPEYTYFDFVSGFILLMLIGRWAQISAVERNQRRLLQHQPTQPQVRVREPDGAERDLPPEQLVVGQEFAVRGGQTVPVNARLISARAAADLAWINGEAAPRVFSAGESLPAGAHNIGRAEIWLCAQEAWSDSLLSELLAPITRATRGDRRIERVIQGYLIAIFAVALVAGVGWAWLGGDLVHAGAIVTAVLVVSCPCALGLAFPLADEMATVALRRRGVFVRSGDLWARLHRVRKLVFDKTGTLTLELPQLEQPRVVASLFPTARSALFSLVRDNPHPVARALMATLAGVGTPSPLPGQVEEFVGEGMELELWTLGKAGWRDDGPADGSTVLAWGGQVMGRFRFVDQARRDARPEIAALQQRALSTFILSGDANEKVAGLAIELGIPPDNAYGTLGPQAKAAWLLEHGATDTLMLGDGANDSLAFDAALCRGTPVIHQGVLATKADFYYLGQGLSGIRALFEINDLRRRTQSLLLVFMIAYNALAVGLAVAGLMNPLFAAVLMPLSSLATLAIVALGLRRAWQVS